MTCQKIRPEMWIVYLSLVCHVITATSIKSDQCPEDLVKETQNCFTALSQSVHAGSESGHMSQSGTMTLDYTQIKNYCRDGGHMTQFVMCVEDLISECGSTQAAVLDRLVSPARVRAAVPVLCQNQEEIEKAGECMNTVMGQDSLCKNQAYDKVKAEMARSIRNVSATFLIQCSFFTSLAECQQVALSKTCGRGLGETHARFLLSFIPNSCHDSNTTTSTSANNFTGSNVITDAMTTAPSKNNTVRLPVLNPKTEQQAKLANRTEPDVHSESVTQTVVKKTRKDSKSTLGPGNSGPMLTASNIYVCVFVFSVVVHAVTEICRDRN
ncbi:unnamed protein product [Lymnaea stagnalis]|uniref:Uncharacterized protein n=1 Tax=Lymnaea stagnalis TaxID=6523 RepID=A0AAV2HHP7_LYMST